jgi:hypothetical protein
MAVRNDFAPGEVLAAADLNDSLNAKLNLAGGKILQIVRATDATSRSTTSTSYVDVTGVSVTITPQKSDSAIFIFWSFVADRLTENDSANFQLTDASNNALSGAEGIELFADIGASLLIRVPLVSVGYSTPATTSSTTYKARFKGLGGSQARVRGDIATTQILAIEVSA